MKVKRSFYTTVEHPFAIQSTEAVVCNLCGTEAYALLGSENDFEIRACRGCGLVYVSPQPTYDELVSFYEAMYPDAEADTVAARSVGAVEPHLKGILQRRMPRGGALLDIGCGYGRFLDHVSDMPWTLHGLEFSETAAEYTRTLLPQAQIQVNSIEAAEFEPEQFDCITMIAVLEHVKDPRAILSRVAGWLKPGGVLLVQVPYIQAFIRAKRLIPVLPIHFEAPRHLFDFSPKTLPRYFNECGFTDIETEIGRPYSSAGAMGTALIWGVKLVALAIYHLTARRWVYPFASSIVVHGRKLG